MLIKVGKLSFFDGEKDIYVSSKEGEEKSTKQKIILSEKDMDSSWIKHLMETVQQVSEGEFALSKEEGQYVLLYVIFSTRERIFFEDIVQIGDQEYFFQSKEWRYQAQEYYWKKLDNYMQYHGYQYKVLSGNRALYQGLVQVKKYEKKEQFRYAGLKLIGRKYKYLFKGKMLTYWSKLGKMLSVKIVRKRLEAEYREVTQLQPYSNSGCLFFKGMLMPPKTIFLKCGTLFGSDLWDEYFAAKRIYEKTKQEKLYMLPRFPESQPGKLVFDFEEKQLTLEELLKNRRIEEEEFDQMLDFFVLVLKDLKDCRVIHRDIHPGNLLVSLNKEGGIQCFRLIDFGCSCVDEIVKNKTTIEKRKNRFAGSMYRFSANKWNDAASALYMLLQIPNIQFDYHKDKLDRIAQMVSENYIVSISL